MSSFSPVGTIIKSDHLKLLNFGKYLRCDGAEYSKKEYPRLYVGIRDSYKRTHIHGSGKPWKQQYEINLLNDRGLLNDFDTGTYLPDRLHQSQAVITKNRVYLIGGYTGGSVAGRTYSAPILPDGTIGDWELDIALPFPIMATQAFVYKNKLYIIGGSTSGSYLDHIFSIDIDKDGRLSPDLTQPTYKWKPVGKLPIPLSNSQVLVTGEWVYLLGGISENGVVGVTYKAKFSPAGHLDEWTEAFPLPTPLANSEVVRIKNKVYLFGGSVGNSAIVNMVYSAKINEHEMIEDWVIDRLLPYPVSNLQAVTTRNKIYLIGGNNELLNGSILHVADIKEDGTIGTFMSSMVYMSVLSSSQAVVTSSKLYLLGGLDRHSTLRTTLMIPLEGGTNDYSYWYSDDFKLTGPDMFNVPDLTHSETEGTFYYILTDSKTE